MLLGTTSRLPLVALAVLIGAAVVTIGNVAISLALRHPLIDDGSFGSIDAPDVALLQFFDAGLALLLLAFRNVRRRRFWLTAIILTAAFWKLLPGAHMAGFADRIRWRCEHRAGIDHVGVTVRHDSLLGHFKALVGTGRR
jgi:hypothetical protein